MAKESLIGMGILPLQWENVASLGLSGFETYNIEGIGQGLQVRRVTATSDEGKNTRFAVTCRIDTPAELDYYRHGGILEYVLRQLAR